MLALRKVWTTLARLGVPLALAVCLVSPISAQLRPHVGPHLGANFDSDDLLVGVHFGLPIVNRLEFYPSFDIYFPEFGTLLGFNGDLKVSAQLADRERLSIYGGGGLNILYANVNDVSETDLGGNLIGGFETRLGRVHPYVEGRLRLHDNTSFELIVGLNVTIFR